MIVRAIKEEDIPEVERIHRENGYDFDLPDLKNKHNLVVFVVVDNDKIISTIVLKALIEMIGITDKNVSVRKRRDAIAEIFQCAKHLTRINDFNQIHAFTTDKKWADILKSKIGFSQCKGESLVLNI